MRRTGKYRRLTLVSVATMIVGNILLATWGDHTSSFEYYVDVIPLGAGYAAFLTTSLIVRLALISY
jgi:hypothetical protein